MEEKISELKKALDSADAVIIGAGSGLSTSAGFTYSGTRFEKYFSDFAKIYGFSDMYSGGFYPYRSLEEHWAYWSRHIMINRYINPPKKVYDDLLNLVRDKDYFVITTNVDHCFQKAGFDKKKTLLHSRRLRSFPVFKALSSKNLRQRKADSFNVEKSDR